MMNEKATKIRRWVLGGLTLGFLLAWYPMSYFPKLKNTPFLVARLERFPGTWGGPEYVVNVYDNGTVVYFGKRQVKINGWQVYKIDNEKNQQIAEKAKAIDFENLKDEYLSHDGYDYTGADVSIRINKWQIKTIEHYFGDSSLPADLFILGILIDEVANSEKFTGRFEDIASYKNTNLYPWGWPLILIPLFIGFEVSWEFINRRKFVLSLLFSQLIFVICWVVLFFGFRSFVYELAGYIIQDNEYDALIKVFWFELLILLLGSILLFFYRRKKLSKIHGE